MTFVNYCNSSTFYVITVTLRCNIAVFRVTLTPVCKEHKAIDCVKIERNSNEGIIWLFGMQDVVTLIALGVPKSRS